MDDVLLVTKPLGPPWHDSGKNLPRDVASSLTRYRPVVLTRRGVPSEVPGAKELAIHGESGSFSPTIAGNARVALALAARRTPELWHFFFAPNPRTSRIARSLALVRRKKTVQTVASIPRDDVSFRDVLFGDRVVVLSRATETRVLAAGIARERVVLVPPCVPLATRPADTDSLRATFGGHPVICFAGDLEVGGGAETALRALSAMAPHRAARLVLACRTKTPRAKDEEARLRGLARSLDLAGRVVWVGETSRILSYLAAADIVALPSTSSYAKMDYPLVLLEAMALERPIVVTLGQPAAELVDLGAGVATAPGDVDALAAAFDGLLDEPKRAAEIGTRGRWLVGDRFTPARVAEAYESVYDALR